MRRVTLSLSAALLLSALALPIAARVDGGCGNGQGWELQPADAELLVATYPSLQRAMDDGAYSFELLVEQVDARDKNDNGWVCVKDVYAWSTGQSGGANAGSAGFFYFINAVDDNPAPK
jgi:hypothetical protein